jgi:hypothetical protein
MNFNGMRHHAVRCWHREATGAFDELTTMNGQLNSRSNVDRAVYKQIWKDEE